MMLNPTDGALMAFLLHSSPALKGNAGQARTAAATEEDDAHIRLSHSHGIRTGSADGATTAYTAVLYLSRAIALYGWFCMPDLVSDDEAKKRHNRKKKIVILIPLVLHTIEVARGEDRAHGAFVFCNALFLWNWLTTASDAQGNPLVRLIGGYASLAGVWLCRGTFVCIQPASNHDRQHFKLCLFKSHPQDHPTREPFFQSHLHFRESKRKRTQHDPEFVSQQGRPFSSSSWHDPLREW